MKRKLHISTIILVLLLLAGIAVLLYPTVSDLWNSHTQSRSIVEYNSVVADLSQEDYEAEFAKADFYNEALNELAFPMIDYEEIDGYEDVLNVAGNGIMGYIEIPCINVTLPIYHGTDEAVLNVAVGHLEGTSLPVGGESTHCVLSGHRGLPSAKLFTNLDKLAEGDTFTITVLDRLLTYEVDQVLVVEPQNFEDLAVVEGEDYVTLMTCTPYGVNTHRLLVRGRRVENVSVEKIEPDIAEVEAENETVTTDNTYELNSAVILFGIAMLLLVAFIVLIIVLLVKHRKSKNQQKINENEKESGENE